jgi:dUTP pyrophosphatase
MNKLERGFEIVSGYESVASIPIASTCYSAGYDFFSASDMIIIPFGQIWVPTGIKAFMPPNEFLQVQLRSSFANKNKVIMLNAPGIIDADYYNNPDNEGHIFISVYNLNQDKSIRIDKGQRIAQGIFIPYNKTSYLLFDSEQKRVSGLGSTGT